MKKIAADKNYRILKRAVAETQEDRDQARMRDAIERQRRQQAYLSQEEIPATTQRPATMRQPSAGSGSNLTARDVLGKLKELVKELESKL